MIPKAVGPYSAYRKVDNIVYVSGQLPINPETSKVESEDVTLQTRQCLANLKAILNEVGGSFDNVVSVTVLLSDIEYFAEMNAEYGKYFTEGVYPARIAYGVSGLPLNAKVEIGAIVHLDK